MTGGGYRLLASGQTSDSSFSAVSTATIATKYSFCRVFRDLQDLHSFAPFNIQNLQIFSFLNFEKLSKNHLNVWILLIFVEICHFRSDFDENSSEFHEFI